MITDWKNKKVAVLGFGVEGMESVRFLHKNGADVSILDRKQMEDLDQDLVTEAEQSGAQFRLGKIYLENLNSYDVIIRSPGVWRLTPQLLKAEKAGVMITSQIKLFFELCPGKIIGVTGTKGKGTTSSLIYEMLKEADRDAYLGGNIGTPPLSFLDKLQSSSWVVLELSSFQLQDLGKSPTDASSSAEATADKKAMVGKPHIAVMLMVTSEHLDHHASIEEYIDAKRNLVRFQTAADFAILNRDYPASNESDIETEAHIYHISRERETDDACFAVGNTITVRQNGSDDEIIKTSEVELPGKHNLENICAAVMAAKLAEVGNKAIVPVLQKFSGLPHRLELVREAEGVRYYDDSFSTTPETAIAAIEAFDAPKILILGGSGKGSDFTELGRVIRESKSIKAIIGIGDEWHEIRLKIKDERLKILLVEDVENMQQVVLAAAKIAKAGDVVLLSPACASFGMFKSYKDRGEQYQKAVTLL